MFIFPSLHPHVALVQYNQGTCTRLASEMQTSHFVGIFFPEAYGAGGELCCTESMDFQMDIFPSDFQQVFF